MPPRRVTVEELEEELVEAELPELLSPPVLKRLLQALHFLAIVSTHYTKVRLTILHQNNSLCRPHPVYRNLGNNPDLHIFEPRLPMECLGGWTF